MWRVVTAGMSLIIIAAGIWLYRAGSQPVFTFAWEPLSRPFEVRPGFEIVAPFRVGLSDEYEVKIDFVPPADRRPIAQGTFTDQVAAVDLRWSITANGKVIAAGDSLRYPHNWFGGERYGRDVGIFHAETGHAYVFRATIRDGAPDLNASAPQVRVALNTNRMTDYGYALEFQPYIRGAGAVLVVVGVLLAAFAATLVARARRAA